MEPQSKPKRKGNKFIVLISSFLIAFIVFIYLITRPSLENMAISELQSCYSVDDVKGCWDRYRIDLHDNEEFLKTVRNKLTSLNLSDEELLTCKKWLPKPPQSLNVIVIPDLSKRIIDVENNPGQIQNDTILLRAIFDNFVAQTKAKTNSKDRLMIDVTDDDQASGNFRHIANDLIFDLSTHKNKVNRLYFDSQKTAQFSIGINRLYSAAKAKPIGADYWFYFNRHLQRNIRKPTLFDDYRNVVILITDGYLEAQNKYRTGISFYTGSYEQRSGVCKKLKDGYEMQEAANQYLPEIRDCQQHFPDLEVLVLEVSERKGYSKYEMKDPGTPCDFEIMKLMWTDWFTELEVKNVKSNFFIQKNNATSLTVSQIQEFLRSS